MSFIKYLALSILLAATLTPIDAGPRIKGDWISSGKNADLGVIEAPEFPFAYNCQAELSTGEGRNDESMVIAVANFTVDNEHYGQVRSEDLIWSWMVLEADGRQKLLRNKPAKAFSLKHHRFNLYAYDDGEGNISMTLGSNVALSSSTLVVPHYESSTFSRDDIELEHHNSNHGYTPSGQDVDIQLMLFCNKIR